MQDIKKYFEKAKLSLSLTDTPIANLRDATDIFQMTIDDSHPVAHSERFRIFPGKGTDVRVIDLDARKSQLLLYVKEPKRRFTEVNYDRKLHKNVETTRETPEGIRRYLIGKDERHLFISELPDRSGKVNKVEDAFRILKPYEVKDRKKRKKVKIHRQGEWFFIEATPEELQEINENIKLVESKRPIVTMRQGKPHIAEYILRIADKIFVRGKIRHEDHKTREFFTWQRVFRNTERISNTFGWID